MPSFDEMALMPFTKAPWRADINDLGFFVIYSGDTSMDNADACIATAQIDDADVVAKALAAPALFAALLDVARQINSNLKSEAPDQNSRATFVKVCLALGAAGTADNVPGCMKVVVDSQLHGEYTLTSQDGREVFFEVAGGLGVYEEGCCESEGNAHLLAASPLLAEAAEQVLEKFAPSNPFHATSARVVSLGTLDSLAGALRDSAMEVERAKVRAALKNGDGLYAGDLAEPGVPLPSSIRPAHG